MWLYAFGSVVRGEIDQESDIDLLAIIRDQQERPIIPAGYLVYSEYELQQSSRRGDLFAHHLYAESKLIYSSDNNDIISSLGSPNGYSTGAADFEIFENIITESLYQLRKTDINRVFELGLTYMAMRDIAMILSYHQMTSPCFSKYAPYFVQPNLTLCKRKYNIMKSCRAASTRGIEFNSNLYQISNLDLDIIELWLHSAKELIREGL